jgi:hypothetical protein
MGQRQDLEWFYAQLQTMGVSQRYQDASLAEMYCAGTQYDGLPGPDDTSVPIRQRRPRVIVPLLKEAVDEIIRFTWGGHNFPSLSIEATRSDDDVERADEIGPRLDKEQAEKLTRFVRAMMRSSQLAQAVKEASRKAAVGRSALLLLQCRNGYLTTHTELGKHCTPTWDPDRPRRLKSVDITYQHPKDVEVTPGTWKVLQYWYKRVIDEQRDIVYEEVLVVPGVKPTWVEDKEKTVDHGLGFCPAVWFKPLSDDVNQIDGQPIVDPQLYPLIDDVNYTISQRSRSIKFITDPQPVVTGVDEDEGDFAKNPGKPWYLPTGADAKYIEMTGVGAVRASEHATDLVERFRDAVHYVKANPETTSGNISGVVLEFLHAPMIALAADLRSDFGNNGLVIAVAVMLQMVVAIWDRGQAVWIQGVGEAVEILKAAQLSGVWLDPPVCIHWAPYFPETAGDKQTKVTYTTSAQQAGFISRSTATKHLASVFGVEDHEAEQDEVDEDEAEAQKNEMASLEERTSIATAAKQPKPAGSKETVPEEGDES